MTIKEMKTADLIALYNQLTGKSIKKFSSRAAGEKQVAAAQAKHGAAKGKIIKGASGGKNGRPKLSFAVQLTEEKAKSKPHRASARAALIGWLRDQKLTVEGKAVIGASIETIESHFKRKMRGVVQKLIEKNWLKRIEIVVG